MKRHRMGRKKSRKLFTKTASKTQRVNLKNAPMRGGIRF